MKFLLVVVFIIGAFEKIVGGITASKGQFPYQISLRYNGEHNCGGSILNQNTVLTAAHCVDQFPSEYSSIVAGSNKLDEGGELRNIARYIIHEKWNPSKATDDIALIKLAEPLEFTTYIQPITAEDTFTPANVKCVLSGWGITSYPGDIPNELQYMNGVVANLNVCKLIFSQGSYPVLDSNICANAGNGIGACKGDSGGPLVSNNKQIGIASWVVLCARGYPDVFTRVSYYSDWINSHLN
ncbi:hypothetical protein RN001_015188 [Aquatica leii]|uniref:Peptidase S1 domain-containing protein n=1 Tax=Aquatica leii TaxID=1421715 RepID=A0AAN7NYW7_9COLE|nr:hypothetical protein RN001_015188 [Aquatica leii]